ncbi:MAG: WXG100 family type VII secretion target [Christensenellales bacterium]|jgi:hypothetical protein
MSNTNFVVSPEALRAAADEYLRELTNVFRALEHYHKAIRRLFDDFSGVTAAAMFAKLIQLTRNLMATTDRILETNEELRTSAGIYEEVERANESLMQELNVGSAYSG